MKRFDWLRDIEQLDPHTDFHDIYRISSTHEFPWTTSSHCPSPFSVRSLCLR